MGVFNWLGDAAWVGGKLGNTKAMALARYFTGTWTVTIGNAVTGNYGTTLQSYYGPYITHVMDSRFGGIAGFLGSYLNEVSPLMGMLLGISGYVTWIYGPNITVNYGGPVANITRASSFTKTAQTRGQIGSPMFDDQARPVWLKERQDVPLGLWGSGTDLTPDLTPAGKDPKGPEAKAINEADEGIRTAVNVLSLVLNLSVAALELAVKFAYSNYDPGKGLQAYNPADDNSPLGGDILDFIVVLLAPRIMAIIYCIEVAGSCGAWGEAALKEAKDLAADVAGAVAYPFKYLGAKLAEGAHQTQDGAASLEQMIKDLLRIGGPQA